MILPNSAARLPAFSLPGREIVYSSRPGRYSWGVRRPGARTTLHAQESLEAARDVRAVVLVVDDDEGLRESCRLILEEEFLHDPPRAI